MGTGGWLRVIIGLKKAKNSKLKSLKGSSVPQNPKGLKKGRHIESTDLGDGNCEELAAIRIQTAFRTYKARKLRRHLKGTVRLRTVTLGSSSIKQASTALNQLHTWSRIQAEIRARRTGMAVAARIKQRKLENQLKLEAKLHDLEVEWSNGPETMEEVLARIHLREEAAVKRERAMAYAFSHQWKANSKDPILGNYELGKAIWGWSWVERWVAARPWESRAVVQSTPKKVTSRKSTNNGKNLKSPTGKTLNPIKSISPSGKETTKGRKLSYGATDLEKNTKK